MLFRLALYVLAVLSEAIIQFHVVYCFIKILITLMSQFGFSTKDSLLSPPNNVNLSDSVFILFLSTAPMFVYSIGQAT